MVHFLLCVLFCGTFVTAYPSAPPFGYSQVPRQSAYSAPSYSAAGRISSQPSRTSYSPQPARTGYSSTSPSYSSFPSTPSSTRTAVPVRNAAPVTTGSTFQTGTFGNLPSSNAPRPTTFNPTTFNPTRPTAPAIQAPFQQFVGDVVGNSFGNVGNAAAGNYGGAPLSTRFAQNPVGNSFSANYNVGNAPLGARFAQMPEQRKLGPEGNYNYYGFNQFEEFAPYTGNLLSDIHPQGHTYGKSLGKHPDYPGDTLVEQKTVVTTDYKTITPYGRVITTHSEVTTNDKPHKEVDDLFEFNNKEYLAGKKKENLEDTLAKHRARKISTPSVKDLKNELNIDPDDEFGDTLKEFGDRKITAPEWKDIRGAGDAIDDDDDDAKAADESDEEDPDEADEASKEE